MTLVNARAAFETAILDAVTDADPSVSVIFDNMPFSTPGKNKKVCNGKFGLWTNPLLKHREQQLVIILDL